MNLCIKKQPPTNGGYSTIADGDEEETDTANVPRVITRRSPWTTIVAVVEGIMLVAIGAVLLWDGKTIAEGVVVATQDSSPSLAAPTGGNFGGMSVTVTTTVYFDKSCLSKSYYLDAYYPGDYVPGWDDVDPEYMNPVTQGLGLCQDMSAPHDN